MKQQKSTSARLVRATQIAVASAAFALVAACGGGGSGSSSSSSGSTPPGGVTLQVVSFGDSLSDVGTYAENILPGFGGGRFTTNPGDVWTQDVATYYGGTLTPAYQGGFGLPLTAAGGMGYAQGGSNVQVAEGEGWAPDNAAATTVPIVQQVQDYLSSYGSFNSNQLVLIDGGANDILQTASTLATQIGAALTANPPTSTAAENAVFLQYVEPSQVGQAAVALAQQIALIVNSGATHVVVSTVPDIGNTPEGVAANAAQPGAAQILSGIVETYNGILEQAIAPLVASGKVIVVDAFTWQDQLLSNYAAQGFTVGTNGTACALGQMEANATQYAQQNPQVLQGTGMTAQQYGSQFGSSLFCSPQTYTVPGADQTYVFADTIHPSTHTHALFAQYVEQTIAQTGLGK